MYRTACRMLRDRVEAEDAVQEALDKAWRNVKLRDAPAQMKPWLFKILVNTCLDHLRTQKRWQNVPYDADVIDRQDVLAAQRLPDELLSNKELGRMINDEIGRLSQEHQTVVQLIIVEQFSYDRTASILDLPVGTVRSRLSRARELLSTRLRNLLNAAHENGGDQAAPRLKLVK